MPTYLNCQRIDVYIKNLMLIEIDFKWFIQPIPKVGLVAVTCWFVD
jgi:hypothetical protein